MTEAQEAPIHNDETTFPQSFKGENSHEGCSSYKESNLRKDLTIPYSHFQGKQLSLGNSDGAL